MSLEKKKKEKEEKEVLFCIFSIIFAYFQTRFNGICEYGDLMESPNNISMWKTVQVCLIC